MNSRERRNGKPPVPDNVRTILSVAQKNALKELEEFGWVIDYVRHPLFQEPRVVMRDPRTQKQAVILEDGTVDHNPHALAKRSEDWVKP